MVVSISGHVLDVMPRSVCSSSQLALACSGFAEGLSIGHGPSVIERKGGSSSVPQTALDPEAGTRASLESSPITLQSVGAKSGPCHREGKCIGIRC